MGRRTGTSLLSVAAVAIALSLSGCTESLCRQRTLLGFLLCDPSLVSEPDYFIEFDIRVPEGRTAQTVRAGDLVAFQITRLPFADDPFYPPDFITREEWDLDGDDEFETRPLRVGEAVSRRYDAPGVYDVSVRVFDLEGGRVESLSARMRVLAAAGDPSPPRAVLTIDRNPVNVDERAVFRGDRSSDADGRIVKWEYDVDRNPADFEVVRDEGWASVEQTYDTYGEFPVRLRVTDDSGLTDIATETMRVAPDGGAPVASFTFSPASPRVRQDITFDSSSSTDDGSHLTFNWDFDGDGDVDEARIIPTYTCHYPRPGRYTVRLRVTDLDGNFAETTKVVPVEEISPAQPRSAPCTGTARAASRRAPAVGARRLTPPSSQPFFARIDARALSAGRAGERRARAAGRGRVQGSLLSTATGRRTAPPRSLRALLRGTWTTRLRLVRGTRGRHRASGIVLARAGAARACARLTLSAAGRDALRGRLRVLGGRGAASRLRATARFRFRLRPQGYAVASGVVSSRVGRPRPLPAACARRARN